MISKWACVKPFLVSTDCDLMCIQETHFLESDIYDFGIPHYSLYKAFAHGQRRQGGACIYVKNVYPHYVLTLQTSLQAVACSVLLGHIRLTICCLYLPPSDALTFQDLDSLMQELPEPFLLCTDANSHHILWGADRCDRRGLLWERVIQQYGLRVLNDGSPTRMDDFTGLDSCIDITLSSSSVAQYLTWTTDSDLHDSDHFPLYVSMQLGRGPIPSNMFYGWNLKKARWDDFREKCVLKFVEELGITNAQAMTDVIIQAADATIPKKTGQCKYSCPWWTAACKEAIAARKRAQNRFRRNRGLPHLLLEFKRAKARARQVIRKAKKDSWDNLLSFFNCRTPLSQLWEILRKFTRKTRLGRSLPILKVNNEIVDDTSEVVNVLGRSFSELSSPNNYGPVFTDRLRQIQDEMPTFQSNNCEPYNVLLTRSELLASIKQCGNTSVGPDKVHYGFLKHIDDGSLEELLKLFNYMWVNSCFPVEWSHSHLIPILKPGKPAYEPLSYRPIQLTSCVSKVMERMIAKRLMWYVEREGMLSNYQCAFRQGRSAIDHVVRLESEVRRGFFFHKYTLAVFLDFKSAYNLVSPVALLWKLYHLGLRGRLMYFLQCYLGERSFQVKCGCFSNVFRQETGLVQGGVISPILFNLMIDDIFDDISDEFSYAIYADDCALWTQGGSVPQLVHSMQTSLNILSDWAKKWGFIFTPSKCQAIIFRRYMNRNAVVHPPPLLLDNEQILYSDSVKFLGVCLDAKLNMTDHVQHLRMRALQRLPLLKCIAGRQYGADRTILLRLYKSLIRPILEYGCQILDGPANKAVESLECVQNSCIRIATGAYCTSPILPLQVEANVQPLRLRRWELLLRYAMRVAGINGHPCSPLIDGSLALPDTDRNYLRRISGFPLFERVRSISALLDFDVPMDVHIKTSAYPNWMRHKCDARRLLEQRKDLVQQGDVLEAFSDFKQEHLGFHYVYTDGSKTDTGVGCAFVHGTLSHKTKLKREYSIFTAETIAILQAIHYIKASVLPKCVICTDSMSVVLALQSQESRAHPLIIEAQDALHELKDISYECIILWVPGHCGIIGNERADAAAKLAITMTEEHMYEVGVREYVPLLRTACHSHFNEMWTTYNRPTNLRAIKRAVGHWDSSVRAIRQEEVVLCRLRLGHTRLTHSYLLDQDLRPECADCDCFVTVCHILLECPTYARPRRVLAALCRQLGKTMDLASLLGDECSSVTDGVIAFLRECDLLQKL